MSARWRACVQREPRCKTHITTISSSSHRPHDATPRAVHAITKITTPLPAHVFKPPCTMYHNFERCSTKRMTRTSGHPCISFFGGGGGSRLKICSLMKGRHRSRLAAEHCFLGKGTDIVPLRCNVWCVAPPDNLIFSCYTCSAWCVCACALSSHLFWTSVYTFRHMWAYHPGSEQHIQ